MKPKVATYGESTGSHWGMRLLRGGAMGWLILVGLTGLLADFLASSQPFMVEVNGQTEYPWFHPDDSLQLYTAPSWTQPVLTQNKEAEWLAQPLEGGVWPLIPYGETFESPDVADLKPGTAYREVATGIGARDSSRFRHLLGTNGKGDDVAALLIHGARHSLWPAVIGSTLAWVLGFVLGGMAALLQQALFRVRISWLAGQTLVWGAAWFWGWRVRLAYGLGEEQAFQAAGLMLVAGGLGTYLVNVWSSRRMIRGKKEEWGFNLRIGQVLDRVLETFDSIPALLLALGAISLVGSAMARWEVMLLLGMLGWVGIARVVRGEVMDLMTRPYIEAGRVVGAGRYRLFFRHLLPNVGPTLIVLWVVGVGSFLLVESTLSFLDIISADYDSWGSMLGQIEGNEGRWWLVIPPGLLIFLTVLALNILAEWLQERSLPQNRKESGKKWGFGLGGMWAGQFWRNNRSRE